MSKPQLIVNNAEAVQMLPTSTLAAKIVILQYEQWAIYCKPGEIPDVRLISDVEIEAQPTFKRLEKR